MASNGEDWRRGKNIVECNAYMLDNQIHTDVIFSVKSVQISAHRTIVISRSSVLEAKLSVRQPSEIILIDDVEPTIFKKMLRFIYCDHVDMEDEEASHLLNVSRSYKVWGLEKLCLDRMSTAITIHSVCYVLSNAENDQQLRQRCLDFIFRNPEPIMKSPSWIDLDSDSLKMIIKDDRFNVKEELIFESLQNWADKECWRENMTINRVNKNEMMRDVIQYIRFGLMDPKYIKETVKPFLSSDLYINVMEQLAEMGENTGNIRKKRGLGTTTDDTNAVSSTQTPAAPSTSNRVFNSGETSNFSSMIHPVHAPGGTRVLHPRPNPTEQTAQSSPPVNMEVTDCVSPVEAVGRCSMGHRDRIRLGYFIQRDQRIIVERFESTQSGKAYQRNNKDGISFISSKNLKLHGILVYGSHQKPGTYKIELEIFKDNRTSGNELQRVHGLQTSMNTDGATKVYELKIQPPVSVNAQTVYTIRALIKGQASYYGVSGQHTVLKNGLSVNFVTDNACLNLTSTEIGQFPGFIFEEM